MVCCEHWRERALERQEQNQQQKDRKPDRPGLHNNCGLCIDEFRFLHLPLPSARLAACLAAWHRANVAVGNLSTGSHQSGQPAVSESLRRNLERQSGQKVLLPLPPAIPHQNSQAAILTGQMIHAVRQRHPCMKTISKLV